KLGTVLGRLPAQLGDLPAGPLRVRPRVVLLLVLRLVLRGLHRLGEQVLRLRVVGRVILRRLHLGGSRVLHGLLLTRRARGLHGPVSAVAAHRRAAEGHGLVSVPSARQVSGISRSSPSSRARRMMKRRTLARSASPPLTRPTARIALSRSSRLAIGNRPGRSCPGAGIALPCLTSSRSLSAR